MILPRISVRRAEAFQSVCSNCNPGFKFIYTSLIDATDSSSHISVIASHLLSSSTLASEKSRRAIACVYFEGECNATTDDDGLGRGSDCRQPSSH